jgi:hypothetical protein
MVRLTIFCLAEGRRKRGGQRSRFQVRGAALTRGGGRKYLELLVSAILEIVKWDSPRPSRTHTDAQRHTCTHTRNQRRTRRGSNANANKRANQHVDARAHRHFHTRPMTLWHIRLQFVYRSKRS